MERVVFLSALLVYAQALNCGIHFNRNDGLTTTINKCVNSNKTLEDLWDMAPMSGESDSSSSEEAASAAPVDGKMMQNFRSKRTVEQEKTTEEGNATEEKTDQSGDPVTENCVIQCIFEELKMTDSTGYPEHTKIIENLTKNVTVVELQDFLQDTTDECFQQMDKEATMDPCAYSVKLVMCLAEKGKSNCSDWPVGDLPLRQ